MARTLNLLGAALPQSLIPASKDNLAGFWESVEIMEIHDRFLAAAGSAWNDPRPLPPSTFSSPAALECHDALLTLLHRDLGDAPVFVIKDPRLCRLMPLWHSVLTLFGVKPMAVLPVRNPLETAMSLRLRNGIGREQALALWLVHMVLAERGTRGWQRVFTDYGRFVAQPVEEAKRIAAVLGCFSMEAVSAALPEIESLWADGLRHHHFARGTTSGTALPPWLRLTYDWASAAAAGDEPPPVVLDAIAQALDGLADLFAPMVTAPLERLADDQALDANVVLVREVVREAQARAEADARLDQARADLALSKAQQVKLQDEIDAVAVKLTGLTDALAQGRAEGEWRDSELGAQLADLDRRLEADQAEFQANLGTLDAGIERLRQHLNAAQAEAVAHYAELESVRQACRQEIRSMCTALNGTHAGFAVALAGTQAEMEQALGRLATLATTLYGHVPLSRRWGGLVKAALTGRLRRRLNQDRDIAVIARSGLFDADYYWACNGDVAIQGHDPIVHYVRYGADEGRNPHPGFDTRFYQSAYPDVVRGGYNPLAHFARFGRAEARRPSAEAGAPDGGLNPLLAARVFGAKHSPFNPPELTVGDWTAHVPPKDNPSVAELVPVRAAVPVPEAERAPVSPAVVEGVPQKPGGPHASASVLELTIETPRVEARPRGLVSAFIDPLVVQDANEIAGRYGLGAGYGSWIGESAVLPSLAGAFARMRTGQPEISVVIPVHNQSRHLLACLDALTRWKPKAACEVVIGDDGSSDGLHARLGLIPGLKLVRHDRPSGFAAICNSAAALASGRIIVILRPETMVLAGAIDALAESFVTHPDCGLVGGCLLSPNGHLYSAGGLLWEDGSTGQFGASEDPAHSAFRHLRDTDYCPAAALAMPRDLWRALGGFDGRHDGECMADADLACRVRANGKRVLYQPEALAIVWADAAREPGHKQAFLDVWQTAVSGNGGRGLHRPRNFAERSRQGRILWLDTAVPEPAHDRRSADTWAVLLLLRAQGWHVSLVTEAGAEDETTTRHLRQMGIECPNRSASEDFAEAAVRLAPGHDAVVVSRQSRPLPVVEALTRVLPNVKLIAHTWGLDFVRDSLQAQVLGDADMAHTARILRVDALAAIRSCHATWVVSQGDCDMLTELVPSARIHVLPMCRKAPPDSCPSFADRDGVVLAGDFSCAAMREGARWFLDEVWPRARAMGLNTGLHVIGRGAGTVGDDDPLAGVRVMDGDADLGMILNQCRVATAPARHRVGLDAALVDCLCHHLAVVATSAALAGTGLEAGRHVAVEDTAEGFARQLVALHGDMELWERLASVGAGYARFTFSVDATGQALRDTLAALGVGSRFQAAVPRFDDGGPIDVSVMVPAYNRWNHTRACIESVLAACRDGTVRWELILADDGSTDETLRAAEHFPGLCIVRSEINQGFLLNCNRAAEQARGRYLLLLNNDTIVRPGWMTALYRLLEDDVSAAIAGSKILYPDDKVQSAGGVLWNNGAAWICGRELAADDGEVNTVREVDYAPGASMMVRRAFWDEVGGFDPRYEIAYCEDADLGMAARAKGVRVLYQPASEVVHFEHGSYTADSFSPRTALQMENTRRMREKWAEAFEWEHLPPATPGLIGAANAERKPLTDAVLRRRAGQLNVLYFSPFPSHPTNHGNQANIQQFGRHFRALGHRLHFVLLQSHLVDSHAIGDMEGFWDSLDILPYSKPLGGDGTPIPFDSWYEDGLGERIRDLCRRYDIDVVFCSYVFQSKLLDYVPAHMLKVIDTHDKMSDRFDMLRAAGLVPEFFSCTQEDEGAYLRRADVVVARREEEAEFFDQVSGRATGMSIPYVEDPNYLAKDFPRLAKVGIVASANRINLAGVRDFLAALDRHCHGGSCPFTVHIAGQVGSMLAMLPADERDLFCRPWVRMLGYVPDITVFYADMDVIASPIVVGTGINTKSVQAMAHGMPLITTACGAKGIGTTDAMHTLPDVETLVSGLMAMVENPAELSRLAAVSRECYAVFHESALANIRRLFTHPKVALGRVGTKACSWPFYFMELRENRAFPCCSAWLHQNELWDLHDWGANLFQMWNSRALRAVRKAILDGSFSFCNPEVCFRMNGQLEDIDDILDGQYGARLKTLVARRSLVVPSPTYFNLCNDRSCNLSCPCCRTELIYLRRDDPEFVERQKVLNDVLDHVHSTTLPVTVGSTGTGDPFASLLMFEMLQKIDLTRNPNIEVVLQTNGILFDQSHWDRLSNLKGCKSIIVIISLDAACEETYDINRRGGNWRKLMDNLAFVSGLLNAGVLKNVRLDMIVQDNNFREVPAFIEIARHYGFDCLVQTLRNLDTFTDAEFEVKAILSRGHPDHAQFRSMMRSLPAYEHFMPGNLAQFIAQ